MAQLKTLGLILLFIVLVILYGSVYTVTEGQRALVLRLGKILTTAQGQPKVINPGLHFKWPFVNTVRRFDVRLQTLDEQSSRILTEQQKYVLVDYYAKWRINDLPLYYTRTGGYAIRAQTLLTQKINDALRAEFGKRTISEVVSGERVNIMQLLRDTANQSAQGLGIKVYDVRIKRIDLPKEVSESVFARMRAEREQVANKHRSDGKAKAEAIRAKADAVVTVLIANAKNEAAQLRAKGLAIAAQIYANAYQKDPVFFSFYRSIEAYRDTFNKKDDILVLKPNGQFFKYFNSAVGSTHHTR